jgi:hypothetical protein
VDKVVNQRGKPDDAQAPPPTRKPYAPPRLKTHGHVKDLVQGTGGKKKDAFGRNSKSCWIAEALYGVDDPRTLLLRCWVSSIYEERRPGWMFVALYRRFGRRTASLIVRGILPRGLFQPVFDVLLEKALTDSAHALVAARR